MPPQFAGRATAATYTCKHSARNVLRAVRRVRLPPRSRTTSGNASTHTAPTCPYSACLCFAFVSSRTATLLAPLATTSITGLDAPHHARIQHLRARGRGAAGRARLTRTIAFPEGVAPVAATTRQHGRHSADRILPVHPAPRLLPQTLTSILHASATCHTHLLLTTPAAAGGCRHYFWRTSWRCSILFCSLLSRNLLA